MRLWLLAPWELGRRKLWRLSELPPVLVAHAAHCHPHATFRDGANGAELPAGGRRRASWRSRTVQHMISTRSHGRKAKFESVYNGVDFEEFELALARRKFIRASLGWFRKAISVIGQVGAALCPASEYRGC